MRWNLTDTISIHLDIPILYIVMFFHFKNDCPCRHWYIPRYQVAPQKGSCGLCRQHLLYDDVVIMDLYVICNPVRIVCVYREIITYYIEGLSYIIYRLQWVRLEAIIGIVVKRRRVLLQVASSGR